MEVSRLVSAEVMQELLMVNFRGSTFTTAIEAGNSFYSSVYSFTLSGGSEMSDLMVAVKERSVDSYSSSRTMDHCSTIHRNVSVSC